MKVAAIVPAGGVGKRLGTKMLKPFVRVCGKTLLAHTLIRLTRTFSFREIIIPTIPSRVKAVKRLCQSHGIKDAKVVDGGATRSESVWNALKEVTSACDWVLIHDAARPLISRDMVTRLLKEAKKSGAALCGIPVTSTVKRLDGKKKTVVFTEDRAFLYLAQTPQVFKRDWLLKRFKTLGKKAFQATDDSGLFDGTPIRVSVVEGAAGNLKITTPADLEWLEYYLKKKKKAVK